MRAILRSVVCVLAIMLATVSAASGAEVFDWARASGTPSDGTVTDDATTTFNFVVGDIGTVQQVNIRFSSAGGYVGDLEAVLESPTGTQVGLFHQMATNYPSSGFHDTMFDASGTPILPGDDPFAGTYGTNPGPAHAGTGLADFIGEDPQGTWKLIVTDHYFLDEATLLAAGQAASWGTAQGTQLLITVPEPASLVLLAAGGLALLRRHRA